MASQINKDDVDVKFNESLTIIDRDDPVEGGMAGIDNKPHIELYQNQIWLKTKYEDLDRRVKAIEDLPIPGQTPEPAPTPVPNPQPTPVPNPQPTPVPENNITADNFKVIFGDLLIITNQKIIREGDTPTIYVTSERNANRLSNLPIHMLARAQSQTPSNIGLPTVSELNLEHSGSFNTQGVYTRTLAPLKKLGKDERYQHRFDVDLTINSIDGSQRLAVAHKAFWLDLDYDEVVIPGSTVE